MFNLCVDYFVECDKIQDIIITPKFSPTSYLCLHVLQVIENYRRKTNSNNMKTVEVVAGSSQPSEEKVNPSKTTIKEEEKTKQPNKEEVRQLKDTTTKDQNDSTKPHTV